MINRKEIERALNVKLSVIKVGQSIRFRCNSQSELYRGQRVLQFEGYHLHSLVLESFHHLHNPSIQ